MSFFRRHRRLPLALALLALLWASLASAFASVPGRGAGAGERVPICTSTGLVWVTLAASDEDTNAAVVCDWCVLHGGPLMPPREAEHTMPSDAAPSAPVSAGAPTAPPRTIWWRPQPHAPPAVPFNLP